MAARLEVKNVVGLTRRVACRVSYDGKQITTSPITSYQPSHHPSCVRSFVRSLQQSPYHFIKAYPFNTSLPTLTALWPLPLCCRQHNRRVYDNIGINISRNRNNTLNSSLADRYMYRGPRSPRFALRGGGC